jgi:hypothetical protein
MPRLESVPASRLQFDLDRGFSKHHSGQDQYPQGLKKDTESVRLGRQHAFNNDYNQMTYVDIPNRHGLEPERETAMTLLLGFWKRRLVQYS